MVAGWPPHPVPNESRRPRKSSNGVCGAESLHEDPRPRKSRAPILDPSPLHTDHWSRDGRWIVYQDILKRRAGICGSNRDPGMVNLFPSRTNVRRSGRRVLADSRWIAFVSTESGPPEVYVAPVGQPGNENAFLGRRYDATMGPRRQELFYAAADNRSIMRVPIDSGSNFISGAPTRRFSVGESPAVLSAPRNMVYDVSPDGRFPGEHSDGEPSSSLITVVLNWTAAMNNRSLMPVHRPSPQVAVVPYGPVIRKRNTTEPVRISSPSFNGTADKTGSPPTNVPFLLPILNNGLRAGNRDARVTPRDRRRIEVDAVFRLSPKDVLTGPKRQPPPALQQPAESRFGASPAARPWWLRRTHSRIDARS